MNVPNLRGLRSRHRTLFRGAGMLVVFALGSGCSQAVDTNESVEVSSHALQCYDDLDNPNCPWGSAWGEVYPDQGGANISNTKSPAVCVGENVAIFSVDTQNHYRALAFNGDEFASSWGTYSTRTFASSPSCAEQGSGSAGLVVAGKGSDNKIYASSGTLLSAFPPQNPTGAAFALVDSTRTYTTGGNPVVASNDGGVALVVMGTDGRTIYSYWHAFPYSQNHWSTRRTGPQLPSGYSSFGTPAMVFLPSNQVFHIVVRAGTAMFQTYVSGSDGTFTNSAGGGGGTPAFDVLPLPGPFSSDPGLTYAPTSDLETLLYLSGTKIMQTSASSWSPILGTFEVLPMPGLPNQGQPGGYPNFAGAPAALGIPLDVTFSAADVFTRMGNRMAFIQSIDSSLLVP